MANGHQLATHVFNDDLLANAGDVDRARRLYGDIVHVLDHPELRQIFSRYDSIANAAKRRRHRDGWLAVLLGGVSLTMAAGLLVFHSGETATQSLAGKIELGASLAAALAGILSVLLAIGVMRRPSKEEWLCGRLMTERLRQLHFQSLICRLPEIVASTRDPAALARFKLERERWLERLRDSYEDKLAAELSSILESPERYDFWLHPEPGEIDERDGGAVLEQVFDAYRTLRIEHQLKFANYKLSEAPGLFPKLPRSQARVFSFASFFCIALLLVADIGGAGFAVCEAVGVCGKAPAASQSVAPVDKPITPVPGSEARDRPAPAGSDIGDADRRPKSPHPTIAAYLHLAVLVLAIIVLAVRALEEGLKPEREVERYVKYRSAIMRVLDRFRAARSTAARIEEMIEMERLAYDEMCDFLRTHHHARFVM